jgi:hypothetical protein
MINEENIATNNTNTNNNNKNNNDPTTTNNKDTPSNLHDDTPPEKKSPPMDSQPSEDKIYMPIPKHSKSSFSKHRGNSMDYSYLCNSLSSSSLLLNRSSILKEPEHRPQLCVNPENVYLKELKLKKYQFDVYRAQFVKMEHDTKIRQREYNNERLKKIHTPLDIPSKLKKCEVKMLKFLQKSKSPYSNKWMDFMLLKNYNSQMKILGFLNGVPKYEIVKANNSYTQRTKRESYNNNNASNSINSNSNKQKGSTTSSYPLIDKKSHRYVDKQQPQRQNSEKIIAFPKIFKYFKSPQQD